MAGTLGDMGGRLVDHPTSPLTNSKGWGNGSESGSGKEHLTVDKSFRVQSDRVTMTENWTGPLAAIYAKAVKLPIGSDDGVAAELKAFASGRLKTMDAPFVSGNSISRSAGNICTLTLEYTQLYAVSQWSTTFNAVEKDIHTWMSDADDPDKRPDIALVRAWEALEPQSDGYRHYEVNGEQLKGNTLELAEMIAKGISSYTIYQPVVSCTYTTRTCPACGRYLNYAFEGQGKMLDAIDKNQAGARATEMMQGQPTSGADFANLLPNEVATPKSNTHIIMWVNTSDRVQHNPDGTFTRSVEFSGVTSVDKNLYYSENT